MNSIYQLNRAMLLTLALIGIWFSTIVKAEAPQPVEGQGCYAYGDDETPSQAKEKAMARAREQAVSSYKVWVESSSEVEDFQLKKDTIQSISAGMLSNVRTENIERKDQEICITIKAQIDPNSVEEELTRRQNQRDIKEQLVSPELTPDSAFGLRIWLNKQDARYVEGDYLVISVETDRDAYLKLDYFQADGTVVHMVPNMFRGQAFIRKGQTYEFGGDNSVERFIISGPFGEEVIKAIASTKPFVNILQSNEPISESQNYVNDYKKGIKITPRGIQVKMAGVSIPLYTTSEAVLHHKKAFRGINEIPHSRCKRALSF